MEFLPEEMIRNVNGACQSLHDEEVSVYTKTSIEIRNDVLQIDGQIDVNGVWSDIPFGPQIELDAHGAPICRSLLRQTSPPHPSHSHR